MRKAAVSILVVNLILMGISHGKASEDAAYEHLYYVMDKFHTSFNIYTDRDARGSNHYFSSGWYNGSQNMTFDDGWTDNPHSGSTCIKVIWDGGAGDDGWRWNGVAWQNPENNWNGDSGLGYDLTGATKLTFWARTDKPGFRAKFLVGYPDDSSEEILIDGEWKALITVPLSHGLPDRTAQSRSCCHRPLDVAVTMNQWAQEAGLGIINRGEPADLGIRT